MSGRPRSGPRDPSHRHARPKDLESLRRILAAASGHRGVCDVVRMQGCAIQGLCDDSRLARPGDVFFAVPGHREDGARFAEDAVARGAVAVVARRPLPVPVPVLLVPDVRRAASAAAASMEGHPSSRMPVVGITGTNGKTSTSELLRLCFEDELGAVGLLGTVRYRLGPARPGECSVNDANELEVAATHTTPGPIAMQRYLAEMRRRSVRGAVLEVSSHALDQGRVHAVQFAAAILTNLTQDHLDYHGDMDAYAAAKARLFASLAPGALAVLPYDDPVAERMLRELEPGVRVIGFGFGSPAGTAIGDLGVPCVRGEILEANAGGTEVRFQTPEGTTEVHLPLLGTHNVRNAMAALACALGLGVGALRASDSLSRAHPVDGRLEEIGAGDVPFRVFVDYAHTPDALERVLEACRPLCERRLHLVFGCGGDRDRSKRPLMGQVARRFADHLILTQDNPRSEDPESIVHGILSGMEGLQEPNAPSVEICHDRGRAIRHALSSARSGDLVLVAGKGHETGQVLGQRTVPFDDREEVRRWLERR